MSIFLGLISLKNGEIPKNIIDISVAQMNDNLPDFKTYSTPDFFVLWKDLGIWENQSSKLSETSLSILAGNPIYYENNSCASYCSSLDTLNTAISTTGFLENSHGTFCGFKYNIENKELHIFSDKLGVRPIYWGIKNDILFFSSSLWILEKNNFIDKSPDPLSISEISVFGYPLGTRSPYTEINTIGDGTLISVFENKISINNYWDWCLKRKEIDLSQDSLKSLKDMFNIAVRDRLSENKSETAFLSGGMDSRLIAANLIDLGADVSTLNFAPNGTQDLIFGALASEALGTKHFELPLGPVDFGNKQVLAINSWQEINPDIYFNHQIWSGDGGSVGLGHVYLTREVCELITKNNFAKAAEVISATNKWAIPKRLLKNKFQYLVDKIQTSVLDEFNRWGVNLPERAAYLFLMTNDQRRHLADHYEKIHLKRFDFKLPFFDARFIQLIVSLPISEFIGHKIYNKWLLELPGKISSIPWQSYPNHYPCPLPIPSGLRYQWVDLYDENDTVSITTNSEKLCLSYGLKCLMTNSPLSPTTLILANLLTRFKIRDQQFFATYARPFVKYFIDNRY